MLEQYPEILTLQHLAEILSCKPESVYEMTRHRSQARQTHAVPFLKLPCGLRFRKKDIIGWLDEVATEAA
jgi:hypothetical protein